MAFAQLTCRERLRDIEACLHSQRQKLYHMGTRGPVSRSTLADANKKRDWRNYAELVQTLIKTARVFCSADALLEGLNVTIYALDTTTIDLCLSVFPWTSFHKTKAAVNLHTLPDIKGNMPTFIHISDGKVPDVKALDILPLEAGAFYVMDRGYLDFEHLHRFTLAAVFS